MKTAQCLETGFIIKDSEKIFGISCPATNGVEPICQKCVDDIPQSARRTGPGNTCEQGERGIDVYLATAEKSDGSYDRQSFVPGKFAFSLSEVSAKKYLPSSLQKLPGPISQRKNWVA